MVTQEMYRGYLIEKVQHSKIITHFSVYSNDGKFIWNCSNKQSAKKMIDMIIDKNHNPFDF